jgi:hypothetical protein
LFSKLSQECQYLGSQNQVAHLCTFFGFQVLAGTEEEQPNQLLANSLEITQIFLARCLSTWYKQDPEFAHTCKFILKRKDQRRNGGGVVEGQEGEF